MNNSSKFVKCRNIPGSNLETFSFCSHNCVRFEQGAKVSMSNDLMEQLIVLIVFKIGKTLQESPVRIGITELKIINLSTLSGFTGVIKKLGLSFVVTTRITTQWSGLDFSQEYDGSSHVQNFMMSQNAKITVVFVKKIMIKFFCLHTF